MATPRSAGSTSVTSSPPIKIAPPLVSSRPAIMRSSVDLPQPEGPTNTTNSPSAIVEIDAMDDMDIAEGFADALEFQTCHACLPFAGSCQAFGPSRARNCLSIHGHCVRCRLSRTIGAHAAQAAACRCSSAPPIVLRQRRGFLTTPNAKINGTGSNRAPRSVELLAIAAGLIARATL